MGRDFKTVPTVNSRPLSVDGLPAVVTGSTTLTAEHRTVLVDATAAAITITLPPAVNHPSKRYEVKKVDTSANTVTIAPSGTETIDGAANLDSATQGDSVVLKSDGTNWRIVSPPTGAVRRFTDEDIFQAVTRQDGSGSGLDADLLDGVQGSGYALVDHSHPGEDWRYIGAVGQPIFENAWTNYSAGYQEAAFRKNGLGEVMVTLMIKGGTPGAGSIAFTLPVGYRPALNSRLILPGYAATGAARIDITPPGEVMILVGSTSWTSLGVTTFLAGG